MNDVMNTLLDQLIQANIAIGCDEMGTADYFDHCDAANAAEDGLRREVSKLEDRITELEQREQRYLWELAGCLTIAEARKPMRYSSDVQTITLDAVNALAERYDDLDAELRTVKYEAAVDARYAAQCNQEYEKLASENKELKKLVVDYALSLVRYAVLVKEMQDEGE